MKANEFVKDNPWLLEDSMKELKDIIADAKDYKFFCLNSFLGHSYDNHGGGVAISIDDLKRLVDSHELVERVINNHNKIFKECQIGLKELRVMGFGKGWKRFPKGLKQAIADVESCQ